MSEMTAMRIRKAATLAVAGGVWCACELLLARTSVPSLDTSGLDVHRYFSQRSLDRAASYTRGADVLWLLSTAAMLAALVVLARVLPTRVRSIGLGRIGSAVIVGMVLIEGVRGTPIRVQDVSKWTDQANAFTVGFGPSTHVVLWDTLLGDRFTRGEKVAVIAHELGHVRSRHIIKGIGWTALVVLPTL